MAKISEIFAINKTQHELDFVNIDPDHDIPLFLNPFIFSIRPDPFSVDAIRIIRSFFQTTYELMRSGHTEEARENFRHLNEPNETCLGSSRGRPQGRGVGPENAVELFDSIVESQAFTAGLVDDLENAAFFIPGIGPDKVSDMTTNIVRYKLIRYTQSQCLLWNIPLTPNTSSGFYWDVLERRWSQELTDMLVIDDRPLLLVPKGVVSYIRDLTPSKYHRHFALEFLQADHLDRNTPLVRVSQDEHGNIRRRYVLKRDLIERELPMDKEALLDFTRRHPAVFDSFKQNVKANTKSVTNSQLDEINEHELVDHLIERLNQIEPGNDGATAYHNLMIGILEYIFYPNLISPIKEREINEGRKRIDISFENGATNEASIFFRLHTAFAVTCRHVYVECKNYSRDIANPELDQMVGRFSYNEGRVGIIVCRSFENEELFIQRCRDSYLAGQGVVLPLTDRDLVRILTRRQEGYAHFEDELLLEKLQSIMR